MPTITYPASATHTNYAAAERVSVFGGEEDTFGAEVTVADLKRPDFAIEFDVSDIGSGRNVLVDEITVEVFYRPAEAPVPEEYQLPPFVPKPWAGVAIGPGPTGRPRLVVVGEGGGISVSDDMGQSWEDRESGTAERLWSVSTTPAGFVAVGNNGVVVTSADGEAWSVEQSQTKEHLYAVAKSLRSSLLVEGPSVVVGTHMGVIRRRRSGETQWSVGRVKS